MSVEATVNSHTASGSSRFKVEERSKTGTLEILGNRTLDPLSITNGWRLLLQIQERQQDVLNYLSANPKAADT
jgi:hypothetical protein